MSTRPLCDNSSAAVVLCVHQQSIIRQFDVSDRVVIAIGNEYLPCSLFRKRYTSLCDFHGFILTMICYTAKPLFSKVRSSASKILSFVPCTWCTNGGVELYGCFTAFLAALRAA